MSVVREADGILLTGATGYVGSFLCRELVLQRRRVVCSVRKRGAAFMRESISDQTKDESFPPRIAKAGDESFDRFVRSLARTRSPSDPSVDEMLKLIDVVEINIGQERLGLDETGPTVDEVLSKLENVAVVLHCAANTSQVLSYEQMREANLATHLLAWCCSQPRVRRVGWISTLSVFPSVPPGSARFNERTELDRTWSHLDSATGYSQSKWVGDCLFRRAVSEGLLPEGGAVFRLGLIGPPSFGTGYINRADWLSRFVVSCQSLNARPASLSLFSVNILPADICARAIIQLLFRAAARHDIPDVHHLCNTAGQTNIAAFFEELPVLLLPEWLRLAEEHPDLPIGPLLDSIRTESLSIIEASFSAIETASTLAAEENLSLDVFWTRDMFRGVS